MKIQQIRNATLKIFYADKIFLIDPYLEEKNKFGCFADIPGKPFLTADNVKNQIPAPICELPFSKEKILENVDYYLLTHIHPDHIDMNFADGTVGKFLDKKISIIAQDENDAKILQKSDFSDIKILSENAMQIGKIKITKTPALHGKIEPICEACGVIFQAEGEKTLYIAGDTIWFDGVKNTLKKFSPEIVVLNACAAEFLKFGRLIMNDEDIDCVHQTLPDAKIFITHMDNMPHATITRQEMRGLLKKRNITNYFMPEDGEILEF